MNFLHVSVSAINLLCLSAAVVGTVAHSPNALTFGVVLGYFANLLAVLIAFVLLILFAIRTLKGKADGFLKSSWLGLANGGAVILAWVLFFSIGTLHAGLGHSKWSSLCL